MAEWATPDKKTKIGVEPEPIQVPAILPFTPKTEPVVLPEPVLVPVRR